MEETSAAKSPKTDHWFESGVMPWLDRVLKCFEFSVIAGIVVLAAIITISETVWVTWAVTVPQTSPQHRLHAVITAMNENWKVGIILLIPLFYRPIRTFLEEVQEAWGMKRNRQTGVDVGQEEPRRISKRHQKER